jgi:hypothetical protein
MPKITVTGQAQPQNEGSIPASQADPMPKMPLAPGSRYVEPAQKTATGTSSVAVSNKLKDDGGIPASMPVPIIDGDDHEPECDSRRGRPFGLPD